MIKKIITELVPTAMTLDPTLNQVRSVWKRGIINITSVTPPI